MTRLIAVDFLVIVGTFWQSQQPSPKASPIPRFEDYAITENFEGSPAPPVLRTSEQRQYRTRIRSGVSQGDGVWSGSWRNPIRRPGPNFAGHYFVIRWGCGSNCLMMAIVDGQTGSVHGSPLSGAGTQLYVSMDPLSDVEVDFQLRSSLMILRNGCQGARSGCGVYYFNWVDNHFVLLKRSLIDLTGVR